MDSETKPPKNSLYNILNKDSVWNKIKKYIYLITFFLFIILILIVCIFILNLFILFKLQIQNPIIPIINLEDGLGNNNSAGFSFEASGNGNRIIINNELGSFAQALYMGAVLNGDVPGTDEIIIKSIAPNSSINPLTNSLLGGALTISTQGDVYFQGNIRTQYTNVLYRS